MRFPRRTTAIALAGAVGLASAAYAIGSQAGGGSAAAARDDSARDYGGPHLDDLAQALGVDAAKLEDALRDYHDQKGADGRDAFATALAKALGKPADEVRSALDAARPGDRGPGCRPGPALRDLAAALDVSRAELQRALGEVRMQADDHWRDRRADLVKFLAERFDLSQEKVDAALPELGDRRGPGPGGPPPGGFGGPAPGGFGGPPPGGP